MKRSRPLALFLSFLILITCFTVSVSASDTENLINSDLRIWENIYSDTTSIYRVVNDDGKPSYCMQVDPVYSENSNVSVRVGMIYSVSDLVAGNSYTFNFHLFSNAEIKDKLNINFTDAVFYSPLVSYGGRLLIGLGSYNSSSNQITAIENCYILIDKNNYQEFYGKDNKITFELPNIVNPCIFISYSDSRDYQSPTPVYNYFCDISLVDNEQAKEEGFFDRIFQFFHDLKWEIIGGSCGDSSCNKTPHTSLADKISNKIEELKESFTDLRDSIDGFFDDLFDKIADFFGGFGNLILYFNWEGDYTNPFEREDSPIDKVSAFFDKLIEYVDSIGTSIENVLDSITGGLHIFDEFTSRFPWLKGLAVFCLALIVITRFIGL